MAYADDLAANQRKQQLAQALVQQGAQPQGIQAGKFFVGPTPFSSLASLAGIVGGGVLGNKLRTQESTLKTEERKRLGDILSAMAGQPSSPDSNQPAAASPVGAPGAMPAPQPNPVMPSSAPDSQRASMLQFLQGMPIEQQQALVGQQALAKLFPKAEEDFTLKPGESRFRGKQQIAALPSEAPTTDDVKEWTIAGKPGTLQEWILAQKRAGGTNVNVNTEKSLYGTMAESQGKANVELYGQAQKAPELLQRAQRVKAALAPGNKVITGAGAEQLLGLSKIAAQFGFNTGDAAADTEGLSRELASATLDNIKASGLGGGSGFSNADRDFLEKAVGGKITLEAQTLRRLADLNEKSALLTIQRWNSAASRLKPDQLKELGMAQIQMPTGTPKPSAQPKLIKNPDGTYTYSP